MKVKIFSHKSDPDGIGSVIVVSLAYQNTSFEVFPNNRELDERLVEFLSNKEYLNYDKIYIADLCPNNVLLKKMASLTSNPFVVYDHHLTSSKETESYSFVHIEASNHECATSLLYDDLKVVFANDTLNTLVYLTRMHDTWVIAVAECTGVVVYDENSYIEYRIHENNTVGLKKGKIKRLKCRIINKNYRNGRSKLAAELIKLPIYDKKNYDIVKAFATRNRIGLLKKSIIKNSNDNYFIIKTLFGMN